VLRLVLKLAGERIVECIPVMGYLHRGIEKIFEWRTYHQGIRYADQADYVSNMLNEHAYAGAMEAIGRLELPVNVVGLIGSTTNMPSGEAMKPGDVVLQIGRTKVHEPEDILDASFFLTAGDVVPITVMRGNEKLTFNVQADFHPASQPRAPLLAAPPLSNRAMPLNLQSAPERTP